MKFEIISKEDNVLEIEYDEEALDILIKAGVYSTIQHAIDQEKIAELEKKLRYSKYGIQKSTRKYRRRS